MLAPSSDHESWDKMVVAGVLSPGVVVLSGHNRPIGWDVKDADGQDGGTTTKKGEPVGEFVATFFLSDDPVEGNDFLEWDAFQALLESSVNGEKPVALEVVHPDLLRNHYTAVVLGKKGVGPMLLDGKGGASIAVDLLEFRPPKPKPPKSPTTATSNGASADWWTDEGAETAADKAVREAEAELQALLEEGKAL